MKCCVCNVPSEKGSNLVYEPNDAFIPFNKF